MALTVEQVVKLGRRRKRGTTPSQFSKQNGFLKHQATRLRRRLERRDPENVPTRLTRGWGD